MGAPLGNENFASGRRWKAAILRALEARGRLNRKLALDALAEKLLDKCEQGDMSALKELGDRLDGKATQSVAGDPDGAPIRHEGIVRFVHAER